MTGAEHLASPSGGGPQADPGAPSPLRGPGMAASLAQPAPGPAGAPDPGASAGARSTGGFVAVLPAGELQAGEARRVQVAGRLIALWRLGDTVLATDDTCTHEKASLSEGSLDVEASQVECPRHGARFDLRTGKALTLPAHKPLRTYPVRIRDGQIEIGVD